MPLFGPRLRRWLLPWLLAVAALTNLAYPMYVHYDFSHSLDTRSYLRMASGRFDSVNITRRYRVLVPGAAAALAAPIGKITPRSGHCGQLANGPYASRFTSLIASW